MRKNLQEQPSLVAQPVAHERAHEFHTIGERLDAHPEIADLILADLERGLKKPKTGRTGLSADTVLRALLVMRLRELTYDELEFSLLDSRTDRSFCGLGIGDAGPSKSALQSAIKKIRAETIEQINDLLLKAAVSEGIERGRMVRVDCTVTETNIHPPSDSWLLWDSVRVLSRLMSQATEFDTLKFTDHTRRAKKRDLEITNAKRKEDRIKPYRDLVKVTQNSIDAAKMIASALIKLNVVALTAGALANELFHYVDLAERVIDQTKRRVFNGEKVPAREKVLSIFEPHTDIIIKSRREIEYGHKICLASTASGLFTDVVIEDGNPADSTLAVRMVERHAEKYGRSPRQVAFDGGFASKANLAEIKAMGVSDVAFNKRRGLKVEDMVKSPWVYRKLYRFRAGIEAGISYLKRCFGLRRCTWSGLASFKAYTWAALLTANLLTLARHKLA